MKIWGYSGLCDTVWINGVEKKLLKTENLSPPAKSKHIVNQSSVP